MRNHEPKKKSKIFPNLKLNLVSKCGSSALNLYTIYVISNHLSPSEMGDFFFLLSVASCIAVFLKIGSDNNILKLATSGEEGGSEIFLISIFIAQATTLVFIILLCSFSNFNVFSQIHSFFVIAFAGPMALNELLVERARGKNLVIQQALMPVAVPNLIFIILEFMTNDKFFVLGLWLSIFYLTAIIWLGSSLRKLPNSIDKKKYSIHRVADLRLMVHSLFNRGLISNLPVLTSGIFLSAESTVVVGFVDRFVKILRFLNFSIKASSSRNIMEATLDKEPERIKTITASSRLINIVLGALLILTIIIVFWLDLAPKSVQITFVLMYATAYVLFFASSQDVFALLVLGLADRLIIFCLFLLLIYILLISTFLALSSLNLLTLALSFMSVSLIRFFFLRYLNRGT